MKKKILIKIVSIIPILLITLSLLACGKNKLTDFEKFINSIYDSELIIAGYNEVNSIHDGDFEIYNKNTNFKIQRGEKVVSVVDVLEKKLSTSGTNMYDLSSTSYTTIDNVKYTYIDGNTYQNSYTMPTYYLTFVLSEEFLEEGYEFIKENDNDYYLKANVLDNKISSLFLNKSVGSISGLSIEIVVKEGLLQSFNCSYKSTTGFDVKINTNYFYADSGKAKAVFYLEGGKCQNATEKVSYVYDFNGTMIDTLIADPNVLEKDTKDQIVKPGYHIEGWYETKVVNEDGTVSYEDKWDFDKDRMTIEGVTLYAKWEINRLYTYELYYYNENGEAVKLDSYEVKEGEKFNGDFMKNNEVKGYTSLRYLDENGAEWDEDFVHPGGDSDLAIKVFLDLIEGEYAVVRNRKELTQALTRGENIYLVSDVNVDGKSICFDSYSGIILGNGHKIYNFEVDYDSTKNGLKGSLDDLNGTLDHLYISLFFELKDATIKDVAFTDMIIDVNTSYSKIKYLVIAPLAIITSNTKLENVNIEGTISFRKTPDCEIEVVYDDFWYSKGEGVESVNSSVIIKEE